MFLMAFLGPDTCWLSLRMGVSQLLALRVASGLLLCHPRRKLVQPNLSA